LEIAAMNGWVQDSEKNPGWYYWAKSDAGNERNWTQQPGGEPPAGYSPDPKWPGWYLQDGADAALTESWWFDGSGLQSPAHGLVLARGIDVASYQPTNLTVLIQQWGIQHLSIRMYQRSMEGPNLQEHSRLQVVSAVANGCSVTTPYYWQYRGAAAEQQVDESLELATRCGIGVKILFADIEKYTDGSIPTAQQVYDGLNRCAANGIRGGIYTGYYIWRDLLGGATFEGVPLWFADYDHIPDFNVEAFGGMVLVGKQYSDQAPDGTSLDCDVFDASVI
jgi:hypothetical protein